jgi:5-formyltetrahydrofolate cyclo-ligase
MRQAKAALRARLRAERDAYVLGLSPEDREQAARAVARNAIPALGGANVVAGYIALGSEAGCMPILEAAAKAGAVTALAWVDSQAAPMRFLRWFPGDPLVSGRFGLLQPSADAAEVAPDLILTPMLGFDSRLMRIGQGAGFYDRAFAAFPDARRMGIAWAVQRTDSVPVESWDMPLDLICTETALLKGIARLPNRAGASPRACS